MRSVSRRHVCTCRREDGKLRRCLGREDRDLDHLELIRNPPLKDLWAQYGEAAKTAVGFFWKAGWAFVLGYAMSGMIQAFVPKEKLTRYMGDANARSISLATAFGAASSSCSFAALAAARSLVLKGAHFVAAVAFMFASTNLVIELGILIPVGLEILGQTSNHWMQHPPRGCLPVA